MSTLYELTGEYKELLEMAESGDYDTETLQDTMEAISGEIEVKADGYAKVMKELEGDVAMLKAEEKRLSDRRKVIENNISAMKRNLEESMIAVGKEKFKTDLFSFNIQKNPARVVIEDESKVPAEYLVEQAPKIDRKALLKDLKDGKTFSVDFARLEQGKSLRIR